MYNQLRFGHESHTNASPPKTLLIGRKNCRWQDAIGSQVSLTSKSYCLANLPPNSELARADHLSWDLTAL